jgi:predicted SnoaL-like aldol condensation-catalyzing enzyme
MNRHRLTVCGAAILFLGSVGAHGQVPPEGVPDQLPLLKSSDPKLAVNKRLVFDMYREIIQGGHTELATKYFSEGYIQHNPNIPSGRDALVKFMKESRPVKPVQPGITFPLISIVAEADFVVVATVSYAADPQDSSKKYASTHFDMYRIENGLIVEHWDNLPKNPALLHSDPNQSNKP